MANNEQVADRNLALELVRVTEAAALAASRWIGLGKKNDADGAAVEAMRKAFDSVAIDDRPAAVSRRTIAMTSARHAAMTAALTSSRLMVPTRLTTPAVIAAPVAPPRLAPRDRPPPTGPRSSTPWPPWAWPPTPGRSRLKVSPP